MTGTGAGGTVDATTLLVAALAASLDACGEPKEIRPGVFTGDNLPERLSVALEELAAQRGGIEALVAHRPGCWEAVHVLALGGRR